MENVTPYSVGKVAFSLIWVHCSPKLSQNLMCCTSQDSGHVFAFNKPWKFVNYCSFLDIRVTERRETNETKRNEKKRNKQSKNFLEEVITNSSILLFSHRGTVLCVALSGNILVSGSRDKSVRGTSRNQSFTGWSENTEKYWR